MPAQGSTNGTATRSRVRRALETVLLRDDGGTVVEECRRCGTNIESAVTSCPTCGGEEVARYRIE